VWHFYVKQQAREESRFFRSFGVKKINELIISKNKFINTFAGLVTSGLGPHVACGPPVGPRWPKVKYER
jgi:hypothetical protein